MLNALEKQTTRPLCNAWQVLREDLIACWREVFEHLAYCGA
jgi:hypothetical protein